jgi:soluble lytic murein transglycosylase
VSSHAARVARRPSRARIRRRRLALLAVAASVGAVVAAVTGAGPLDDAVREITLPLRHDDVIRQQAADKGVDAALIAAVIYEESRFRDQTSHAGARGLMQITPETADFIARRSGGSEFEQSDLASPQINIAYGAYYLRYLLDHYGGDETLAIAAYNAGQTNVDGWVERAGGADEFDSARDIPFPETRAYVANVQERRDEYREHYADDLGL